MECLGSFAGLLLLLYSFFSMYQGIMQQNQDKLAWANIFCLIGLAFVYGFFPKLPMTSKALKDYKPSTRLDLGLILVLLVGTGMVWFGLSGYGKLLWSLWFVGGLLVFIGLSIVFDAVGDITDN